MERLIEVQTTVSSIEEGEAIARALIEGYSAACVQISGPITSLYRWNGNVETSHEWRLTIKTLEEKFSNVESVIRRCHSYEVPEIYGRTIDHCSSDYRKWVLESLQGPCCEE